MLLSALHQQTGVFYNCCITPCPCIHDWRQPIPSASTGSGGHVVFESLNSTRYTLRVVATNRHPDTEFTKRRFEITSDPQRCTLYLINRGITVSGDSATVEFSGRGPANGYHCVLDKIESFECEQYWAKCFVLYTACAVKGTLSYWLLPHSQAVFLLTTGNKATLTCTIHLSPQVPAPWSWVDWLPESISSKW